MGAGIIDDSMVGGWDLERRMEPGLAVSRWEPGLQMGARVWMGSGMWMGAKGINRSKGMGWSKAYGREQGMRLTGCGQRF